MVPRFVGNLVERERESRRESQRRDSKQLLKEAKFISLCPAQRHRATRRYRLISFTRKFCWTCSFRNVGLFVKQTSRAETPSSQAATAEQGFTLFKEATRLMHSINNCFYQIRTLTPDVHETQGVCYVPIIFEGGLRVT